MTPKNESEGEPLSTAGGGNLERGEVNRNKQSPQCGVAQIEVADIATERNKFMKNSDTKVITGKVRFSYCSVWEPKSINGGEPRYSVSLLIPKSDK